jgi:tetratricopeptide (TPR) repeat protein
MQMKLKILASAVVTVTVAIAAGLQTIRAADAATAASATSARAAAQELQTHNLDIAFYEKRVREDTTSAADLSQLALLYLQRARETGEYEDYLHAEDAARRSLSLRSSHNIKTYALLASALLAQHRFAEALDAAQKLDSLDEPSATHRALLGEVQLELGMYDDARGSFASLGNGGVDLTVVARIARFDEITGKREAARRLLFRAVRAAQSRTGMPREQLAWFYLRYGDLALRAGHLGEAETAFRGGLAVFPQDYRLLGAMARLEAARHEWKHAIEYGDRAIATVLDPVTLGVMSDAYTALGDTARASEFARAMEVAVLGQPGPLHRAWGLFLLDHDQRVDEVADRVREELRTRRDVYGYDLMGWALHKQRRDAEAEHNALIALSQGTEDALLYYHAGMIERSLGRNQQAGLLLTKALQLNPYFHPTQSATASAVLDSLQSGH